VGGRIAPDEGAALLRLTKPFTLLQLAAAVAKAIG
jgi:hypothetical protein